MNGLRDPGVAAMLPYAASNALLAGRLNLDGGPSVILVRDGQVEDVTHSAPTMADLLDRPDRLTLRGQPLFNLEAWERANGKAELLAPVDLQVVKAAGVTFAVSAIERVIEERARGDAASAAAIRDRVGTPVGSAIRSVLPGSADAGLLKQVLIEEGLWSQYLEVAIGPDAEIFTKTAVLASVGSGADIGVRSDSSWNNPEPEIVLVMNAHGEPVGATLGNDVNLRDFEGRSALLLSKAKDNNASCAIGPFIRLFDESFTMTDVRSAVVELEVRGADGFVLTGKSSMCEISRDPEELVRQAYSEHHYPDGLALFLGTLFAPVQDRDEAGKGFTHKEGDVVRISTPAIGTLVNRVTKSAAAPAWSFGVRALMRNLAGRGLLAGQRDPRSQ